jgi:alpha-tubulin suppressor-like RCC1 family protein
MTGQALLGGADIALPSATGVSPVSLLATSESETCALSAENIACWGEHLSNVMPSSHVSELTLGNGHGCYLDDQGAVWCWGVNVEGQLGRAASSEVSREPSRVDRLTGVSQVAASFRSTCALTTMGTVFCWGSNAFANLGDGTLVGRSTPAPVSAPQ